MPVRTTGRKIKNRNDFPAQQKFTAVFENGVLKPLRKVRLPESKELTILVHISKGSIAEQMYGLLKSKKTKQWDAIIESEDWL
ncbi:DUF104 domain-containing protein [candidate division KSB1 bacterium]|nr:MAG: DUF104 domain-containing protein [candidate division KSB1 bacterium]MBC6948998.1 DUF104 domain-containing protein [candidate division KSB1 bacterium]MCE7941821.1 DUF104 domain-containing protein [Chlorobi bacterium CHB1]MDL1874759.1 DUF104 domain-containing protein [Cytophagia bacterium CHB2]